METVEHFARIALVAELLGGAKVLPKTEVDKLLDSRTRYGVKTRPGASPDCPVVAEDLSQNGKKLSFTRDQLVDLIDQVLKSHGLV
jgi:L-fuculose-phosphate aldolase